MSGGAPQRHLRILLLTHYYPPELGAPQTRLHETARGLQDLGHSVRVLTGPPHYPDGTVRPGYTPSRPSRETIDGVPVLRLPMIPRRNGGLLDRTIDQASFAFAALAAVDEVRASDVVLVDSPPLFLGGTALFHRAVSGRPYLFHVADPWPDFPIAMGALANPFARRAAFALEDAAYRGAGLVTTVTPGLVDLLDRKPAAHGKVRLLPNGVATERFHPERDAGRARRRLGWPEARLNLVYAGSVGLAQGLRTLLDAAALLAGGPAGGPAGGAAGGGAGGPAGDVPAGDVSALPNVLIHVVGEGFERDMLARATRERGIESVRFEAPVAPGRVPDVLAAADGILVMLKSGPLYEHSLPTKLVEGLAAGRPLIVSASGESARIVTESGAGIAAPAEDSAALAGAIRQLAASRDRDAMGARGRELAERVYDRRKIVAQLAAMLAAVESGSEA